METWSLWGLSCRDCKQPPLALMNMAISLTTDVISHSVKRGSPIYSCSIDAEGAFDAIPFPVLFQKAIGVLPDPCWRYKNISVQVRWKGYLGKVIRVMKSTRHGGPYSCFI